MDSQKRMLIALGLSFALTLVYMTVFAPKSPPTPVGAPAATQVAERDAGASVAPATTSVPLPAPAPSEGPVREVERDFPLVRYLISSRGGGLIRAELEGEKMREQVHVSFREGLKQLLTGKEPFRPQMQMAIPVPGQPLPLSISISGSAPVSESLNYRVETGGERQLTLLGAQSGWEVSKAIEWSADGLHLSYLVTVKNTGSQPAGGELGIHYVRAVEPASEEKPSFFGGVGNLSGAACRLGDDLKKLLPDEKPPAEHRGPINFFGIDQQYFLVAIFPLDGPLEGRCVLTATPSVRSSTPYFPIQVMPGQSVTHRIGAYVGPKEVEALGNAGP